MLLASVKTTEYFGELRSYFSSIMMTGMLLIFWRATLSGGKDFDRRSDMLFAALIVLTLTISLQIHFVGSFIQGVLALAWLATLAARRYYRWFAVVLGGTVAGSLFISTYFVVQSVQWKTAIDFLWISTSPLEAIGLVAGAVALALVMFPAVTFAAFLRLHFARGRRTATIDSGGRLEASADYRLAILIALVSSAAILMVVNYFRPILVGRHMLAYQPMVYAILADLAWTSMFARPRLTLVLGVNVAGLAIMAPILQSRVTRWDDTIRYVARAVEKCRDTRVYAMDPWFLRVGGGSNFARREGAVFGWAYRTAGRQHRFPVTILRPGDSLPAVAGGGCRTLLWVEHYSRNHWGSTPEDMLRRARLRMPDGTSPHLRGTFLTPEGTVLSIG
jgi:hypothetical protein